MAHQRSVSRLAERVETKKAMGQVGVRLAIEPAAQSLDSEAAEPLSFHREPLLECWGADCDPGKKIAPVEGDRLFERSRYVGAGEALEFYSIHSYRIRLQGDDIALGAEDAVMVT